MNKASFGFLAAALALLAVPASAHHSFAMFDREKTTQITGTLKEFEWTNPHTWVRVLVAGADGKQELWALEAASTGQQTRIGWSANMMKPGDKISIQIHPMKDGTRGGQLVTITLPDGRTLGHGGMANGKNVNCYP